MFGLCGCQFVGIHRGRFWKFSAKFHLNQLPSVLAVLGNARASPRSALGVVDEQVLAFCGEVVAALDTKDIAVFLANSVPSKTPAAQAQASTVAPSAGGVGGLPSAPSDTRMAARKAAVRGALVEDFDKVTAVLKKVRAMESSTPHPSPWPPHTPHSPN